MAYRRQDLICRPRLRSVVPWFQYQIRDYQAWLPGGDSREVSGVVEVVEDNQREGEGEADFGGESEAGLWGVWREDVGGFGEGDGDLRSWRKRRITWFYVGDRGDA